MNPKLAVVSIIGRPNVGKSCLFNRLVGQRRAIVDATPGVTRDRLQGVIDWEGRNFELVDTGGLTLKRRARLDEAVAGQVKKAIDASDLLLFVADARDGPVSLDMEIAALLRKSGKKVILVVNKVDNPQQKEALPDFFELGLGEPMGISALHGLGIGEVLDEINKLLAGKGVALPEETAPIKVAIVGRPNVGKSTLVNALLGEERVIVDEEPGTTRDAIDTRLEFSGREYLLIDTAGLIHPRKAKDQVEFYSASRSVKAIRRADITLCLIDGYQGLRRDDLRIFQEIERSGRGAIMVINKWDLVSGVKKAEYVQRISRRVSFMHFAPVFFTSAKRGEGVFELLEEAGLIHERRVKKYPTHLLNEILKNIQELKAHPIVGTRRPKFSYITQTGIAPPVFTVFANFPEVVKPAYLRFMDKAFRKHLNLSGTPVKFIFREKRAKRKK